MTRFVVQPAGAPLGISGTGVTSRSWLVRRAALAVALMVGFYAFALTIALGLLWIPYAEWIYFERIHWRIAIFAILGGGTVLWAIVPRADRFVPPGPRLDETLCPDLFRMIREVAAATKQEEPTDVYLLNEVNAWVTQRGGVMGFGSTRVMGIGLPLLQGLSQEELKAIIAHEFGHYSSGDVALGPWIYKTRAAIVRAVQGLDEGWLSLPFQWYGTMFIRLTHAVSRQQEFIADRIAAQVTSPSAAASALRQTTALAPVFEAYMGNELWPVVRAGFLPPIASGFSAYIKEEQVAEWGRGVIATEERDGETDEFDTHPSLKERVDALGAIAADAPVTAAESAATLLPDAERYAAAVTRFSWGAEHMDGLKPLSWSEVGESVYIPQWREFAKTYASWLSRFTPDMLPTREEDLIRAGSGLVRPDEEVSTRDGIGRAVHALGVGLSLALLDRGWVLVTRLGRPFVLMQGAQEIDPFATVHRVATGQLSVEEWKATCSALGISGCVIAQPGVKV